jgi:hypothetical protein
MDPGIIASGFIGGAIASILSSRYIPAHSQFIASLNQDQKNILDRIVKERTRIAITG